MSETNFPKIQPATTLSNMTRPEVVGQRPDRDAVDQFGGAELDRDAAQREQIGDQDARRPPPMTPLAVCPAHRTDVGGRVVAHRCADRRGDCGGRHRSGEQVGDCGTTQFANRPGDFARQVATNPLHEFLAGGAPGLHVLGVFWFAAIRSRVTHYPCTLEAERYPAALAPQTGTRSNSGYGLRARTFHQRPRDHAGCGGQAGRRPRLHHVLRARTHPHPDQAARPPTPPPATSRCPTTATCAPLTRGCRWAPHAR